MYEQPTFKTQQYYSANTSNSIEIDTYLTDPSKRHSGIARILVYEGIKKNMLRQFEEEGHEEVFLCSTLHRKNLSSKYVSEFFGLTDSLFVKRRQGRDREVHICRIDRENYLEYLKHMEEKLIVLYGYNPNNISLPIKRKQEIFNEQLRYEKSEFKRLNRIRHDSENKRYTGSHIEDMKSKLEKIRRLRKKIKSLSEESIGDR